MIALATGMCSAQNAPAQQPANASTAEPYRLQTGDDIEIKVFNIPELSQEVQVRPDGMISAQMVNDIPAAGVRPSDLAAQLAEKYSEYFNKPKVSVIVKSFANLKIFVGGEVARPGVMPLVGEMSALSAVIGAGGFRPTARKDQVVLVRNDGRGGRTVQVLNLKNPKDTTVASLMLQPFDILFVPESRISKVDQFVDQNIRQVLPGTLNGGFSYLTGNRSTVVTQVP